MKFTDKPSDSFQAFAKPLAPIITSYDHWQRLLLLPSLVAARGRARSFSNYHRKDDALFGLAECHFLDSSDSDALAARHDDCFCIAIHDAVAYQLLDIFSLAFSCPGFFAEIGDPSKEDIKRVVARQKTAGYGFFRNDNNQTLNINSELAHPNCPVRSQASLYFTGMALDAIWSHELAHAFMGHIDYANRHLGMQALNETPAGDGNLRQMPLEAEADRFSCATLVQSSFGAVPYLPKSLSAISRKTRLKASFVVSALLTWYWALHQRIDRQFDGVDPYVQGSHPPPLARLHLSFGGGRDMLTRLGWDPQNVQHAVYDAMSELECLAEAKDWFSILHPARCFDKDANEFVLNIKKILADTFRTEAEKIEAFRYSIQQTAS